MSDGLSNDCTYHPAQVNIYRFKFQFTNNSSEIKHVDKKHTI